MAMRTILAALLLSSSFLQALEPQSDPSAEQVRTWIEKLSDDHIAVREEAVEWLILNYRHSAEALRSLKNETLDLETRARLKEVLSMGPRSPSARQLHRRLSFEFKNMHPGITDEIFHEQEKIFMGAFNKALNYNSLYYPSDDFVLIQKALLNNAKERFADWSELQENTLIQLINAADPDSSIASRLRPLLNHQNQWIKILTLQALSKIQTPETTIKDAISLLQKPDETQAAYAAIGILTQLQSKEHAPLIAKLALQKNLRGSCLRYFAALFPREPHTQNLILESLSDPDEKIISAALDAVVISGRNTRYREAVEAFLKRAKNCHRRGKGAGCPARYKAHKILKSLDQ